MKLPLRYEQDAAGDVGLYDADGTILGWGFKPADARALCRAANAAAGLADVLDRIVNCVLVGQKVAVADLASANDVLGRYHEESR